MLTTIFTTLKLVALSLALAYASYQDIKTREVSDFVWAALAAASAPLTALEILLPSASWMLAFHTLSSVAVTSLIALLLYRLDFMGGADVKCLICVSVAFPWHPLTGWGFPKFGPALPLFSLSVLANAALCGIAVPVAIFAANAVRMARGENLFAGLEHEHPVKRFALLFVGVRASTSKLANTDFYKPLEVVDGGRRKIVIAISPQGEPPPGGVSWMMPVLPFVVNISVGFITALLAGDLTLMLVRALLALLA